MTTLKIAITAAIAVLLLLAIATRRTRKLAKLGDLVLTAKKPLTPFEIQMYTALASAVPEFVVLAQVALSALLTTNRRADRNRFDRKVADFVICTKQLVPIVVIELDDSSHNKKQAADADRDAMLRNAGYQTIRYRNIPQLAQLKLDVEAALQQNINAALKNRKAN